MRMIRSVLAGLRSCQPAVATGAHVKTPDKWIGQAPYKAAHEVTVTYYDSDKAPCARLADGIAIATVAIVGQGILQIAPEKATAGAMAEIVIRNRKPVKP